MFDEEFKDYPDNTEPLWSVTLADVAILAAAVLFGIAIVLNII